MLEQVAVGADNKDLSVTSVKKALEEAGRAQAATFFIESESERTRANALASDLDIPVAVFAPMSADIVGGLTQVAEAIANSSKQER